MQSIFKEPKEETIFALIRLQKALMKSGYSDAGKDLLDLRRQGNITLPRYAWSGRKLIGKGVAHMVSSGIKQAKEALELAKPFTAT